MPDRWVMLRRTSDKVVHTLTVGGKVLQAIVTGTIPGLGVIVLTCAGTGRMVAHACFDYECVSTID